MNIGIVLAVSDYKGKANNLPACKRDGEAIAAILNADRKFEDVLVVDKHTSSGEFKPQLIEFINRHKDEPVEDVVFYFTGHGEFKDDEFYYLLSDYDPKRRKQTSLENSELDNLLRTLSPNLAVKIVDACHSGVPYIKDPEVFGNYLKSTQSEFSKCYFLFSSQTDQYSYQDDHLSYFTKSITESLLNHSVSSIRYKDVLDYVSDTFESESLQTPFYVVQADFTEIFCTITDVLRSELKRILSTAAQPDVPSQNRDKPQTLLELVSVDAQGYCSEEETLARLEAFANKLEAATFPKELDDLYTVTFSQANDLSDLPDRRMIGKWIEESGGDYFAEAEKKRIPVSRRVPKNPLAGRFLGLDTVTFKDDNEHYRTVEVMEEFVTGYKSTIDLPYTHLTIIAEPRFPNLPAAVCYVAPIVSRTRLQVFTTFGMFKETGWNTAT